MEARTIDIPTEQLAEAIRHSVTGEVDSDNNPVMGYQHIGSAVVRHEYYERAS